MFNKIYHLNNHLTYFVDFRAGISFICSIFYLPLQRVNWNFFIHAVVLIDGCIWLKKN